MNRSEYQAYLQSARWQHLSKKARQRAGWKCQLCGARGELHVHHRSYDHINTNSEWRDLIVLCERCHHLTHLTRHHDSPFVANRVIVYLLRLLYEEKADPRAFTLILSLIGRLHYTLYDDPTEALLLAAERLGLMQVQSKVARYLRTFVFGTDRDLKGAEQPKPRSVRAYLRKLIKAMEDKL